MKYTIVCVTLAASAMAASSSMDLCLFSTTISEASAIPTLNGCKTLSGEITLTGDSIAGVDLSRVQKLEADLRVFNSSSITSIDLSSVEKVAGSVSISALTRLESIQLSALTSAKQLSFVSLPSLASLNLGLGLANVLSLTLSDTALSSIDKLLNFKTIEVLNVNNNKNVTLIDLSGLESVTRGLTLSFNNDQASVKLDDLRWAANLTLQDIGSLSISRLQYVNGSCVIAYNSFKEATFQSLTNVGASLQVFANDDLESLSLLNLTNIDGEFRMFNNSRLDEIDLERLKMVKGAMTVSGDLGNFTLPALEEVRGDFSVVSSSQEFSCAAFKKLHDQDKIKGHNFNCTSPSDSKASLPGGSGTPRNNSGSGSGSSSSRSSGGSVGAPVLLGYAFAAAIAILT